MPHAQKHMPEREKQISEVRQEPQIYTDSYSVNGRNYISKSVM